MKNKAGQVIDEVDWDSIINCQTVMNKSREKTIDLGNFGFSYYHVPSLDSFSPENCAYFSLLIECMFSSRLVEMQFVVWNVFH